MKSNKKGNGVIITLLILIMVAIVAFAAIFMMSNPFSANGNAQQGEASAKFTAVSSNLGTDFEGDLETLRIESSNLTSSPQTVTLTLTAERDDTLEDLTTGGKKFKVEVAGLTDYDSWNDDVTSKVYFVTYDSTSEEYSVSLDSGSNGDLDSVVAIGTSTRDIVVSFEMATLEEANNIVKTQYKGQTFATVNLYNDEDKLVDSYSIEYFRTTASS